MTEAFFTSRELADYLRLDYNTVLSMAKRNELPCFKVGKDGGRVTFRYPVKAIEEWIARRMADYERDYEQNERLEALRERLGDKRIKEEIAKLKRAKSPDLMDMDKIIVMLEAMEGQK